MPLLTDEMVPPVLTVGCWPTKGGVAFGDRVVPTARSKRAAQGFKLLSEGGPTGVRASRRSDLGSRP